MNIFVKPDSHLNSICDKYKRGRENTRVSLPIEYNGKKYRGIIFNPASLFGNSKNKINGVVFVDENELVVTEKRLQKELSGLLYNFNLLLEDSFLKNLTKAVISEDSLKLEEEHCEFFKENLLLLSKKNIEGAEIVSDIIQKLTGLKRENNYAIEKFLERVNAIEVDGLILSDKLLNEIKPLYMDTLMKNFEKVKLIGTGRNYYGDIKREALKAFRNKSIGTMGSRMGGSAVRTDYELSHLLQVVSVYDSIIEMSQSEYLKYLRDVEKERIDELVGSNRA